MAQHYFYAVCPFGLEKLLADELHAVGAQRVEAGRGGCGFVGGTETAMAACLHSRTASRILMRVAQGGYWDSRDIYDLVKKTAWEKWFGLPPGERRLRGSAHQGRDLRPLP